MKETTLASMHVGKGTRRQKVANFELYSDTHTLDEFVELFGEKTVKSFFYYGYDLKIRPQVARLIGGAAPDRGVIAAHMSSQGIDPAEVLAKVFKMTDSELKAYHAEYIEDRSEGIPTFTIAQTHCFI